MALGIFGTAQPHLFQNRFGKLAPDTPIAGLTAKDYGGTSYQHTLLPLTGITDGKVFTVAGWFRIDGGAGSRREIYMTGQNAGAAGNNFEVSLLASNKLLVLAKKAAGATIFFKLTTPTYAVSTTWHQFICSADLTGANSWLMVDGAIPALDTNIVSNDTIDWTRLAANHNLGGDFGGEDFNGCLSEIFFDTQFMANNAANVAKFRTAAGKPAYLGADGSLPFGTQPLFYCPSGDATGTGNVGSGGAFIAAGPAVTVCSSAPGA